MSTEDHTTPVQYREVPDRPYRVGDDGDVQGRRKSRVKGSYGQICWRSLKPQRHTGGYLMVHFYEDYKRTPKYIHRLVLELFVGPCPDGMEACHLNGIRTDNRLVNLRWDTRKNNHADKVIHGTLLYGSRIGNSKLTEADISVIKSLAESGMFQRVIAERFGVTQTLISQILGGKVWKHIP